MSLLYAALKHCKLHDQHSGHSFEVYEMLKGRGAYMHLEVSGWVQR